MHDDIFSSIINPEGYVDPAVKARVENVKLGGMAFADFVDYLDTEREAAISESVIKYAASKHAVPFHEDRHSKVKALMSCVGSGKSTACIMELLRLAALQTPDAHGIRWSRVAIIRATYGQLESTTLNTWQTWVPESVCSIIRSPRIRGHIRQTLSDGTIMDMDVRFMAIDDAKWLSNLQGLELTFFWINEFAELTDPEAVFKVAMSRLNRYPSKHIARTRWSGGLLDYNPPPIQSYPYELFETKQVMQELDDGRKVPRFKLYKYPPPLLIDRDENDPDDLTLAYFRDNPEADYAFFQDAGFDYWRNLAESFADDDNYIRRMVLGDYTLSASGKPIFTAFNARVHVGITVPDITQRLLIGMDGGLMPALVLGQIVRGQLQIHEELVIDDIDTEKLLDDHLIPLLNTKYNGFQVQISIDPGNNSRNSVNKMQATMIMNNRKLDSGATVPVGWNKIKPRHDAVNWFLRRRDGLLINRDACPQLIAALAGNYRWALPKGGKLSSHLHPVKDRAADIADALQYLGLSLRIGHMAADDYEFIDGVPRERTQTRAADINDGKGFLYA